MRTEINEAILLETAGRDGNPDLPPPRQQAQQRRCKPATSASPRRNRDSRVFRGFNTRKFPRPVVCQKGFGAIVSGTLRICQPGQIRKVLPSSDSYRTPVLDQYALATL
jgi:hypothetical protein